MKLQDWMNTHGGKINRTGRNGLTEVLSAVPDTEFQTVILPRPTPDAEWEVFHLEDYAVSGRYGVHTFGMIRR